VTIFVLLGVTHSVGFCSRVDWYVRAPWYTDFARRVEATAHRAVGAEDTTPVQAPKPRRAQNHRTEGPLMARLLLNEICWPDGDLALIARGVVDDGTVAAFETEIARGISTTPVNLLIDVSECELASAGLAALLHLQLRRVTSVVLVATSPAMLSILRISGVASRYRIYSTLAAARDACHNAKLLESNTSPAEAAGQPWTLPEHVPAGETAFAFTRSVGAVLNQNRMRPGPGAQSGRV
jgi:anti-anti-sigma regulatory factor